jgi:hypothetical protein
MIRFLKRIIISLRILMHKKSEPFYSSTWLINYIRNGYYFPSYKKQDFRSSIKVEDLPTGKYVSYTGERIAYPGSWNNNLILNNFNNIINEQTGIGNNVNPHKYFSPRELSKDWIVYDIGAAEGWQSKIWIKFVQKIVIFEPLPSFFEQLSKTFSIDVEEGKVILLNCGVSDVHKEVIMEGKTIVFDNLPNLINAHKLPYPDYIKADIEGEEMNFLTGSKVVFDQHSVKVIQITTYHRPDDYINIPEFFKQYKGLGSFSAGILIFNRDGLTPGHYRTKIYHPVIRKCLYTFNFSGQL